VDHGLYHFSKPDAVTRVTFAGIIKDTWFP
jgi:hypothetical protein